MIVWTKDETKAGDWEPVRLHKFNDVVWHLSWSFAGNILAVSGGDNSVSIIMKCLPCCLAYPRDQFSQGGLFARSFSFPDMINYARKEAEYR